MARGRTDVKRAGAARALRHRAARAQEADVVELGLLARVLVGALARLIALVEQLDLLELLERLAERRLGVVELTLELVGGALEILLPPHRGLGVGRIGEMRRIVDAGALLLGLDLAVEIGRHALELGDHALDLRDLAAPLVDLKLLQPNERVTRLHLRYSPGVPRP